LKAFEESHRSSVEEAGKQSKVVRPQKIVFLSISSSA
jgi:hypothetical protein